MFNDSNKINKGRIVIVSIHYIGYHLYIEGQHLTSPITIIYYAFNNCT